MIIRDFPKKATGIYNINTVIVFSITMELITKKLDNLSQYVNMVH